MTARWLVASSLGVLVALLGLPSPASAAEDVTYYPLYPNGQRVYLSVACHDRVTDGVCMNNTGCEDLKENTRSGIVANALGDELLARQYPIRIGKSGVNASVNRSNNWNARMHIPLHSNANQNGCADPDPFPVVRRRATPRDHSRTSSAVASG